MATTIRTKRTLDAGKEPDAGSLALGELAVNVTDGKLWVGDQSGDPKELVGGDGGGGGGAHNDLSGRTVALCHPLAAIYDPTDEDDKNLATILTEMNDNFVEEPPTTPTDTYYARSWKGEWAPIDLSVPAAAWGSITGNISAQTDLYSTFAAKSSTNTISGAWTFNGWTGYNSGIRLSNGSAYVGGASSAFGAGISGSRYVNVNNNSSGLVSNNNILAVDQYGNVIQPNILFAGQIQFVTNQQLGTALRQLAAAPPAPVVARMMNDPADAFAAMVEALADIVESTDYGSPNYANIQAETMRSMK